MLCCPGLHLAVGPLRYVSSFGVPDFGVLGLLVQLLPPCLGVLGFVVLVSPSCSVSACFVGFFAGSGCCGWVCQRCVSENIKLVNFLLNILRGFFKCFTTNP